MDQLRRCVKCCCELPLSRFSPENRPRKKIVWQMGRRAECKTCNAAAVRAWKERNRERLRAERTQRYHNDAAFREKELLRSRIRYGRPEVQAKLRAARRANPELSNARRRLRRAKTRGSNGGENVNLLAVAQRDRWRCHICKQRVRRKDWSLDHLIPLSRGGPHTYANVALAHQLCNSRRYVGRTIPAQLRLL
jgi:5-methylcytosine-specific restriction endonuclease McrA